MQAKIKRIINMLFYHESWDIMIIKDHGTHLFPDNTLEILNKSAAQQLKRNIRFRPILFLLKKTTNCMFFMKLLASATRKARSAAAFLIVN